MATPEALRRAQAGYEQRRREAGDRQIKIWLPADVVDEIDRRAREADPRRPDRGAIIEDLIRAALTGPISGPI